ncbi:DUF1971 domain-containing protein [Sphingobium sp. AR-3-1]|uniref:DUF1971 domain-containing protein n=1 Tax=Sphingobium psychrophilum TaxID=2728834 RepID=A0A7X9WXR1_9SPHN|nr:MULTISPECIES: DUF1971 domain-containing protein [Sphingobium]NML11473.1 DUF1971 domain-containing protein [Sphingobium psychrophilum]
MLDEPYRSTPIFDEVTLPKALRRDHRTKAGTWGLIRVLRGTLKLTILEPASEILVTPGAPAVILPEQTHFVEPVGPMEMQVDFFDHLPRLGG